MKRRSQDENKDHFDLLPFIAILMCVLGCLLLVTMSIAALSIGPGVGEGWIPAQGTKDTAKIPRMIEWDGQNAVFHLDGGRKASVKYDASNIFSFTLPDNTRITLPSTSSSVKEGDGPSLDELLGDLVKDKNTHYALIAVRPSGFESFIRFAYLFRSRDIQIGYEPIEQEKSVRLLPARRE